MERAGTKQDWDCANQCDTHCSVYPISNTWRLSSFLSTSVLICVSASGVTFKLTYRELPTFPWIWTQANSLLATKSLPDGLYKTDKKGNRVRSKEKWEEYPATAGSEGGGTEREPACISGLLSCWHITARNCDLWFGAPPVVSTVPLTAFYWECIRVRNKGKGGFLWVCFHACM